MPFGLQPIHLVVIFVVALLIFGPRRLPEMGRGIGRAINEFRKGTQEMTDNLREEVVAGPAGPAPVGQTMAQPQAMAQPQPVAQPQSMAQPQAAGNFCPSCGNSNPAGARFCNKCGTTLPV
jgi:sec-independent protein translocase protein TatA